MKRKIAICLLLAALMLLSGCMSTMDQLYCLPKRSKDAQNLQSAIDSAMTGLSYCAPLSGENQQTVQTADLDGDGVMEYLVFAKGTSEKPLKILIFCLADGDYVLYSMLESNGSSFDQVEYIQMDGQRGMELVVGRQVSDQVLRSISVYTFDGTEMSRIMNTNYTKFLTCDLDSNGRKEVLLLRPGQSETDNGVAELYTYADGMLQRSNEAIMSEPVDQLKRIITGKLQDGEPAVYVASTMGESAIITDVYAMDEGSFRNVSLSNESGTSVQTIRNYYVYACDIDGDGVVELPDLINMTPLEADPTPVEMRSEGGTYHRQYLIRWYAMRRDGTEADKLYTFHNYADGWFFQLNESWVSRITVVQTGQAFEFYIWDTAFQSKEKMLTIYALTGTNREDQAVQEGRFVLYRTENVVYAGELEDAAYNYGINKDYVINGFHLIQQEWKTGETD